MKSLSVMLMLGVLSLGACAELPNKTNTKTYATVIKPYKNHVRARVTYYHRHEDKFGSNVAIGGKAKEGITIAVRQKLMALGHACFIPQFVNRLGTGYMRVEDRGRDVERLKASHKKEEVADVYLECKNRHIFNKRVAYYEKEIGPYIDLFY
jgi:hypothetical protein